MKSPALAPLAPAWRAVLAALPLTACDGPGAPRAPAPEDAEAWPTDGGGDAAPSSDTPGDAPPGVAPASMLTVIHTMGFATPEEGVEGTPGFDLDGQVSDGTEPASCGHADATGPDGTPGIDNQLATLVPLFALAGIGAAEGLIQDAVTNGGLLLMFQLDGLDDRREDDDVRLTLRAGAGTPLLGTDGLLLAGQTFALHPESPEVTAGSARVAGGVLEAGPFDLPIPVSVFGFSYRLVLTDTRLRARLTEDGGLADGLLGGAVAFEELREMGRIAAMDDGSVLPAIEAVFGGARDLRPGEDGVCTHVSGAFRFTAVSAFLY
jgi:hypothetical protein